MVTGGDELSQSNFPKTPPSRDGRRKEHSCGRVSRLDPVILALCDSHHADYWSEPVSPASQRLCCCPGPGNITLRLRRSTCPAIMISNTLRRGQVRTICRTSNYSCVASKYSESCWIHSRRPSSLTGLGFRKRAPMRPSGIETLGPNFRT